MKHLPYYDRSECEFDLDHEITQRVKETKEMLSDVHGSARGKKEYNAIVKAMIETMLETL